MPLTRRHFWDDVARLYGRLSCPVKTSLKGTIPAFANIKVGSLAGTIGPLGTIVWPRSAKKCRNASRIWAEPVIAGDVAQVPGEAN